jgi:hypothetical protein
MDACRGSQAESLSWAGFVRFQAGLPVSIYGALAGLCLAIHQKAQAFCLDNDTHFHVASSIHESFFNNGEL